MSACFIAQSLVAQVPAKNKPAPRQGMGQDIELIGTRYRDELPPSIEKIISEKFLSGAGDPNFEFPGIMVPGQTEPEAEDRVVEMLDPIMKSLGFKRFTKEELTQVRLMAKKSYPQMYSRLPAAHLIYWTGGEPLEKYLNDITCWSERKAKEKYKAKVRQMWISFRISSSFVPVEKAFKSRVLMIGPTLLGTSNWVDKGDMNILKENIEGSDVREKLGNTITAKINETAKDFEIKVVTGKPKPR
jgi:hypothetical protein